jgi:hypothetical protein
MYKKRRKEMEKMTYELGKLRMERFLEESKMDSDDGMSQNGRKELPSFKRFSLNLQRSFHKLM